MTVAVISSIMGGYDQPAAPPTQSIPCDWLLVTDSTAPVSWPWRSIVEPRPGVPPRLAAKVAKCRPDHYTDADVTIWVDGHLRVTSPDFAAWALEHLGDGCLAQLAHPQRDSLTVEAALSSTLPKYRGQPVVGQVSHYLAGGYPDRWGLWATGLIVRRHDRGGLGAFGDAWLAEQVRWTLQDQLSEPPLLWRLGLRPATLPGPLLGHPLFTLTPHADGTS